MGLSFVSYSGEYPNLCSGILILSLDGKRVVFPDNCLYSGGYVTFNEDGSEEVGEGPWSIATFPEGFPSELETEAERLVNENVVYGCCGGCI